MRVLAVTGASDRSESHLLLGIAKSGVELHVVGEPGGLLEQTLASGAVPFTPCKISSRICFSSMGKIRSLLQAQQFDVLHAFTGRAVSNGITASLGMTMKRIAYRGTVGNLSKLDPMAWLSFLNPKLDKISCVSNAVKISLEQLGIRSEKLFVIHKGHEPEWYSGGDEIKLSTFGLPENSFVVSCVANIRPLKGVDVLIRAVAPILKEREELYLVIVGEVRDQSVVDLANRLGVEKKVKFQGFLSDAFRLARITKLYIQPSLTREGLPKSAIEFMIQGVPTIVSDAGGLPELVRHNQDGLVVKAGDAFALEQAIRSLISDSQLLSRFSDAARARILSAFSLSTTLEKTLALY